MRNRILLVLFAMAFNWIAYSQDGDKKFISSDSLYNENIQKARLYGVYIPKDLDDALKRLDKLTSVEAREKMKKTDELTFAKKTYYGIGRWMSYNWNFDEGSRFVDYLRQNGLSYKEDMINFMLISFHRHTMNKPLETESLFEEIAKNRQKKIEEEMKKKFSEGEIIERIKKSDE